jgi:hypothetical protein
MKKLSKLMVFIAVAAAAVSAQSEYLCAVQDAIGLSAGMGIADHSLNLSGTASYTIGGFLDMSLSGGEYWKTYTYSFTGGYPGTQESSFKVNSTSIAPAAALRLIKQEESMPVSGFLGFGLEYAMIKIHPSEMIAGTNETSIGIAPAIGICRNIAVSTALNIVPSVWGRCAFGWTTQDNGDGTSTTMNYNHLICSFDLGVSLKVVPSMLAIFKPGVSLQEKEMTYRAGIGILLTTR